MIYGEVGVTVRLCVDDLIKLKLNRNYINFGFNLNQSLTFFGHHLSVVELQPSSSLSTSCVVQLREDWAIFCHTDSGQVGTV